MAFPARRLVQEFDEETRPGIEEAIRVLENNGLTEAIDITLLDDDNVMMVAGGCVRLGNLLKLLREKAQKFKGGWATLTTLQKPNEPHHPHRSSSSLSASSSLANENKAGPSQKRLRCALTSIALQVTSGRGRPFSRSTRKTTISATEIKSQAMNMAVEKVHAVFMEHASTSPRLAAISKGPKLMSSMQLDVYKTGSRSPRVVANKARLANFFSLTLKLTAGTQLA